jgi:hypothetical protein
MPPRDDYAPGFRAAPAFRSINVIGSVERQPPRREILQMVTVDPLNGREDARSASR